MLLPIVLDPVAGASLRLVLDATDLTGTARAWASHSIPFTFQGAYFPWTWPGSSAPSPGYRFAPPSCAR
jgi:hypothetical protein